MKTKKIYVTPETLFVEVPLAEGILQSMSLPYGGAGTDGDAGEVKQQNTETPTIQASSAWDNQW